MRHLLRVFSLEQIEEIGLDQPGIGPHSDANENAVDPLL